MSLLFAEHGVEVNFYDPSEDNVKILLEHTKEAKREDKIVHQNDYKSLCAVDAREVEACRNRFDTSTKGRIA